MCIVHKEVGSMAETSVLERVIFAENGVLAPVSGGNVGAAEAGLSMWDSETVAQ